MRTVMSKRLDTIESIIPAAPCTVCASWPAVLVSFQDAAGNVCGASTDGWPDAATCPDCGREPKRRVTIERMGAAPQAATLAS